MTLAHDRSGRGSPLVLLHPLGADRRVWDPLLEHLAHRREVIAIDLPGFGESPPLRNEVPSPRALAAAVAEDLASLGVDRPHVAGNSLGGWVALELGLSGAARSVTGIAPAGLWPEPLVPKAGIAHRLARATLPLTARLARSSLGRSLLLSDSGHIPMWDAPEELAQILFDASGGHAARPSAETDHAPELAGDQL